jgi:hypothetical protein
MMKMKQTVTCLIPTASQAAQLVNTLRDANFRSAQISILMINSPELRVSRGTPGGAGADTVIGGALGWLTGIETITVSGVGPMIAAGPIVDSLSAAPGGAHKGDVNGLLTGLGLSKAEARQVHEKLREGCALLSVYVDDVGEAKLVETIFRVGRNNESHRSVEEAVSSRR